MNPSRTLVRRRKFTGQQPAAETAPKEGTHRHSDSRIQRQGLSVGKPNDKYEQEADRIADKVVNNTPAATVQRTCAACEKEDAQRQPLAAGVTPLVQRMPEEEPAAKPMVQRMEEEEPAAKPMVQRMEEEEPAAKPMVQRMEEEEPAAKPMVQRMEEEEPAAKPMVQRREEKEEPMSKALVQRMDEEEPSAKPMAQRQPTNPARQVGPPSKKQAGVRQATPWAESKIAATRGMGTALPKGTLNFMESRMGADLSKVRIHNDETAHALSQNLHAQAFTVGHDVYFNRGFYNPQTKAGQHLLAHELTHTLQQKGWVQRQENSHGKANNPSSPDQNKPTKTLDTDQRPSSDLSCDCETIRWIVNEAQRDYNKTLNKVKMNCEETYHTPKGEDECITKAMKSNKDLKVIAGFIRQKNQDYKDCGCGPTMPLFNP